MLIFTFMREFTSDSYNATIKLLITSISIKDIQITKLSVID